ncbi:hypothetical protein HMPREF9374_1667 [Desmospora sp. 8437]|nr:hypothetical protein HMPREF9374_1667 [Desmospora sp. 8437]
MNGICDWNGKQGGLDFTWSDFGSEEQPEGHVKPHPDRLQRQ